METDNPADHYNTVFKMAKKRALVDAVLTTTAASDIFTQDLEDISACLALLAPSNPATTTAPPPSVQAVVIEVPAAPASPVVPAEPQGSGNPKTEGLEFRHVPVHFGKNRGLTLADLTPQQLHWYETEWMPKKITQGNADAEDRALMGALQAYREWREAEKKSRSRICRLPTEAPPPSHSTTDNRPNRVKTTARSLQNSSPLWTNPEGATPHHSPSPSERRGFRRKLICRSEDCFRRPSL